MAQTALHTDLAHAGRGAGMLDALKTRWSQYRVYRRTFDELSALTDRELADLGLHRAQLNGVAYEAAYGTL